jgi:hypothetical protein
MAAAACLALAAATLLIPSAPTTDPWGWIVWGREIAHLKLDTAIGGAPSWKPLPVLFTTPLSVFGAAAPSLWLVVARAGGLLGLVAAYTVGSRLAGRYAGALAAVGLLLSAHLTRAFLHGYSEPLAIALLLFAVERHWSGRERQALVLMAGVSLARPEAFALVLAYALLMWWRSRLDVWTAAAAAVAVPALWVVPDWIGSGNALHGSHVASAVEAHGPAATLHAAGRGLAIAPVPLSLGAVAGFAIARRAGDRRTLDLSMVAAAWALLLVGLMAAGYPASGRFFVLPAALVCVLGAAGTVRAIELTGSRRLAAVAALVSLPLLVPRVVMTGSEADDSVERAQVEAGLAKAIAEVGPRRVRSCGVPVLPRGLSWLRGDVAWRLGVSIARVRSVQTTGDGYIASLSRYGDGAAPARVTVGSREGPFTVLDPFGSTRLRLASRAAALEVAGGDGRWRVLLPDRRGCGRVPTRAA